MLLPIFALALAALSDERSQRGRAKELGGRLGMSGGGPARLSGLAGRLQWVQRTHGPAAAALVAFTLEAASPPASRPWPRSQQTGLPIPPRGLRLPQFEPLVHLIVSCPGAIRSPLEDAILQAEDLGPQLTGDLRTIADWWHRTAGEKPSSWTEARAAAMAWHDERFKRELTYREPVRHRGIVLMRDRHGGTIERLVTPESLEDEGNSMGHCIGRLHQGKVMSGEEHAFSYRDAAGKPQVTWTMEPFSETSEETLEGVAVQWRDMSVEEVQGPGNEPPENRHGIEAIAAFMYAFDGEDGIADELDGHIDFPMGEAEVLGWLIHGGLNDFEITPHFEALVGSPPDQAAALSNALGLQPEFDLEKIAIGAKVGAMVEELEEAGLDYRIQPDEMVSTATKWVLKEFTPDEAVGWIADGVSIEDALAYERGGWTTADDTESPMLGSISAKDLVNSYRLPSSKIERLGDEIRPHIYDIANLQREHDISDIDLANMVVAWMKDIPHPFNRWWLIPWARYPGMIDESDINDLIENGPVNAEGLLRWLEQEHVSDHMAFPLSKFIRDWRDVEDPGEWMSLGFEADEAKAWIEAGASASTADEERGDGFTPETREWPNYWFSRAEADAWIAAGAPDPETAIEWRDDYTPEEAAPYLKAGMETPDDIPD